MRAGPETTRTAPADHRRRRLHRALHDQHSGQKHRVVGLTAHGLGQLTRVEELLGFVEYRHVSQEGGA
jgi:hypothetical protein